MNSYLRAFLLGTIYLVAAQTAFTCFAVDPGLNADARLDFVRSVESRAERPFVYRCLMPGLTQMTAAFVGEGAFQVYTKYRWDYVVEQELLRTGIASGYGLHWWVFSFYSIALFALYAFCFFSFLRRQGVAPLASHALAWSSLLLLPIMFGPINTVYDPGALALFPLATLALLDKRVIAYYLVFVLAILNKETALLLIAVFAVLAPLSKQVRLYHVMAQTALFAGLSLGIRWWFHEAAGGEAEWHLWNNLRFLTTPSIALASFLLKLGVFIPLAYLGWPRLPQSFQRLAMLLLAPLVLLWLVLGRVAEIRVFYEVYFLLCLMGAHGLCVVLGATQMKALES